MKKTFLLPLALVTLFAAGAALADTVYLKDGSQVEGTVVEESDTEVKVRVQFGPGITDLKTYARADIERIEKLSEEDIEFASIEKLVPTPPMLSTSQYETRVKIASKFLTDYPNAKHAEEAEKILATLKDESAKVSKGFVKLGDEWISPEDAKNDPTGLAARTLHFKMEQSLTEGQFIAVLRAFEEMEENYKGTPSFVPALESLDKAVRGYGAQIQKLQREQAFEAEERAKLLERLSPADRAENERIYKQQQDAIDQRIEADKTRKVKWLTVNPKSAASLEEAAERVEKEIELLAKYDRDKLTVGADLITEARTLLASGDVKGAKDVMKTASRELGRGAPIVGQVNDSIKQYEIDQKAAIKAAADAEKARQAAELMKDDGKDGDATVENVEDDPLAAYRAQREQSDRKDDEGEDGGKKAPTKPKTPVAAADSGGGGISFQTIIMILAGIMVLVTGGILVMKKKQEDGEE